MRKGSGLQWQTHFTYMLFELRRADANHVCSKYICMMDTVTCNVIQPGGVVVYIPRKLIQNYSIILQKNHCYMYCLSYDVISCCCLPENFITVPTFVCICVPEKRKGSLTLKN